MRTSFQSLFALSAATLVLSNEFNGLYFVQDTGAALVIDRVDPILLPGVVPGNHVHSIVGSNAFKSDVTYDDLQSGTTCSTVFVKPDKSIYWLPSLYFQDPKNGSFNRVPERPEHKIYYMNRIGTNETMNEFPKGFKMIAGDAKLRSPAATTQLQQVTQWYCHSPDKVASGFPKGITGCGFGMAGSIHFPHCWNGNDFDINDPTAHMSYPMGDHPDSGYCPPSHPHGMPHIFIEFWFTTTQYDGMYSASDNPWVLANGDPTGYGFHADFINGWDQGVLLNAMKNCDVGESGDPLTDCFDIYTPAQQQACKLAPEVKEEIDGWLPSLPGCNPVQSGPAMASATPACNGNGQAVAASAPAATQASSNAGSAPAASQVSDNPYTATKTSYKTQTPAAAVAAAVATAASSAPADSGAGYTDTSENQAPTEASSSSSSNNNNQAPVANAASPNIVSSSTTSSSTSSSEGLPSGWTSTGCYSDNLTPRSMSGIQFANIGQSNSPSICINYCAAAGYSMAGTEYGTQCFCGNELVQSSKIDDGKCSMPCRGHGDHMCGGTAALSVYKMSSGAATTKNKNVAAKGSASTSNERSKSSAAPASSWKPRYARSHF